MAFYQSVNRSLATRRLPCFTRRGGPRRQKSISTLAYEAGSTAQGPNMTERDRTRSRISRFCNTPAVEGLESTITIASLRPNMAEWRCYTYIRITLKISQPDET